MTRKEVLEAAAEIVCKDREEKYGKPENNFELIAKMWSIWLDTEVTASDVAMMMAMLKIARIKTGKPKDDNYIDLIGYVACMAEIDVEKDTSTKPKFDINNYKKDDYVMHCNTKEKARRFCNYLDSQGKRWYGGQSYKEFNPWNAEAEKSCYEFNKGAYGDILGFAEDSYSILEFDDFDWS